MHPLFKFKVNFYVLIIVALTACENSADTTCQESQKHFANLCFTPKPTLNLDFNWAEKSQPDDGWHIEIGNDIARLHNAEAIRGEFLGLNDDFGNTCFRSKIEPGIVNGEYVAIGTLYGFANLTSKWVCNASRDFPGVSQCDVSSTLSKYHEYLHTYVTYSDNKNVIVSVSCFPNGQVGWMASSITKSLTGAEKKAVNDHITSLGFSSANTVVLYDEAACSNETK